MSQSDPYFNAKFYRDELGNAEVRPHWNYRRWLLDDLLRDIPKTCSPDIEAHRRRGR